MIFRVSYFAPPQIFKKRKKCKFLMARSRGPMNRYNKYLFSVFLKPHLHPPLKRILKGLVFLEIFKVKLKNSQKVSHFAPPPIHGIPLERGEKTYKAMKKAKPKSIACL